MLQSCMKGCATMTAPVLLTDGEDPFRWRDLLRIGPGNDPFWLRVRAGQLHFLQRNMLMNVPIALVHCAIVLLLFRDMATPLVLLLWAASQMLSLPLAILAGIGVRRSREERVTPAKMLKALAKLALFGCGWGLLFFDLLARVDTGNALLLLAMTMAGIGSLAFSTSTWPLGTLALSGTVALGSIAGLLAHPWQHGTAAVLVIAIFILYVARNNILAAKAVFGRVRLQDQLTEQGEVMRLLLNEFEANGKEWLYEFGPDGRLTFASKRFAEVLHRPVEDVIGQPWRRFITDTETSGVVLDAVARGQPFRDQTLKVRIDDVDYWWSLSGTPKLSPDGRLMGYRGVGTDVTERHLAAQRIADLATFDTLTGLVNRRIVQSAVEDGLRSPEGLVLLFVDLDRFKAVNDSIGHGAGDLLLATVARRLRQVAGGHGLVGRLGGDEFAIVLRGGSETTARLLAEEVIAVLSEPYAIGESTATIGASVGMAIGPADGATVEALMRAADLALYDVKERGRGSVRQFDRAIHERAEQRRALEMELRGALKAGQLWLAFQPIVDAMDERVVGFEALMRWRHPRLGEVSPATFIPIAEESGQIGRLGRWALEEACRVAAGWPKHIKFSVNLSPLQFDDADLVTIVRRALERWKIQPERLELELTESLFLDQRPQTRAMLEELLELGVGFALDDFGTGYSSLGYLQKIAFSRIKIDRSFVRACLSDGGESTAIIQAIVALAGRLGMQTTAEGTETRAEFEAMRRLGCAQVQGFLFGRPMPADEAGRLLARSQPLILVEADAKSAPAPTLREGSGRWRAAEGRASLPRPEALPRPPRG